jgi:hypothetical protein
MKFLRAFVRTIDHKANQASKCKRRGDENEKFGECMRDNIAKLQCVRHVAIAQMNDGRACNETSSFIRSRNIYISTQVVVVQRNLVEIIDRGRRTDPRFAVLLHRGEYVTHASLDAMGRLPVCVCVCVCFD